MRDLLTQALGDGARVAVIGSLGAVAVLLLIWLLTGCSGSQPKDWGALTAEVVAEGVPEVGLAPCEDAPPGYRLTWSRELQRWASGPRGRAVRLEGQLQLVEECPEDKAEANE